MIAARREDLTFFKWSLVSSLIAHFLLFSTFFLSPSFFKSSSKEPVYYVSLMSLPGGSGGGEGKSVSLSQEGKSLKELTKFKSQEPKSKLRYPDSKKKKETPVKKKKKTVVSKSKQNIKTSYKQGELTTGIGSGGTGIGIGFGEGRGISSFPYTYYVLLIRDKVSNSWYTSLIAPGLSNSVRTIVYFRILRNGQISDVKIEESSGIKSFDLSALRAIYSASPFPPLPTGFEGEYLGVHFIFEHSK